MFTARYVLHSTFCPHSVFMCFVWIWEQTAIISLYSIDWLIFITETESVYCAVRAESLTTIHFYFSLKSVSHVSVTPPVLPCQCHLTSAAMSVSPHQCSTHIHLSAPDTRKANGRSLVTFHTAVLFLKSGNIRFLFVFKCLKTSCLRLVYSSIGST